jgi:hypothetical protein
MKRVVLAIAVACAALTGCAAKHGYPAAETYYRNMMTSVLSNPSWYSDYFSEKDPVRRKELRDRFIGYCIWLADEDFNTYATKFDHNQAMAGLIADWSSLAMSGASAIATPAAVYGAIATGIQGAHAAYDRNMLAAQTRSAILMKMDALRADHLIEIYRSEQLPDSQYSLVQGLIDVQLYVNAGTVHEAIAAMSRDAAVQHQSSSALLKELRKSQ